MTEGFVCWLCGQQAQQKYSPYCPDCEVLEHDRATLATDIREWGKLGEKLMGEWDSDDLPFSDETSVTE
jgi:hypothetical protein